VSLLNRIQALNDSVENLKTAKVGINEAKLLQARYDELTLVSEPLTAQIEKVHIFKLQGIELSELPSSVTDARNQVSEVSNRFSEKREAKSLTKGKNWEFLRSAINSIATAIDKDLSESWKKYVVGASSGEPPENLKAILAPTDQNRSALDRYQTEFSRLNAFIGFVPNSQKPFEDVKRSGSKLKQIYKEFDFDVPDEVKIYLDAVGRGGAGLDLLTQDVRAWLTQNRTLSKYKIVANK